MTHTDTRFPIAEKFFAPQGEGLYTGTPMAFVRLVGCSVGQKICTACDTDFTKCHENLGGGMYTTQELFDWVGDYDHICITGGEPLDRDIRPLLSWATRNKWIHIETSGTKRPNWLIGSDFIRLDDRTKAAQSFNTWLCVSPKPGYRDDMITICNEVKVILGGLGDGEGWPSLDQAVRWADEGKLVYIQQRNRILDIDRTALDEALRVVDKHPNLRLSVQLHKFLHTR